MEVSKVEFDKDKVKFKIAISKIKEENDIVMKNRTRNIFKAIITAIAGIVLGTGVVFAGTKVYEKIWKEPESYTYEEMINALPSAKISDEEKIDLISEDEAKEKGIEILEKLGYENQTINRIELKRGYSEDITSYYMIKTKWGYEEGLTVEIDANSGDFLSFNDMDLKYKHLQSEILTDEEISKIATDIYNQLELKEGEYKLSDTKVEDYYFENQASKLLGAKFYKYYDGIKNKYEQFSVSFIVVDGKVILNSVLLNKDTTYQKNPLVISEEEAVNIVKSKEQEFSSFEITNITSELSIEKMNTFIYQIENDKYDITANMEEQVHYKTDDISRKVWKIKIEHNVPMREYADDYNKYVKEGMDKIYYIDTTTGEIIGGKSAMLQ
jgi:hypothetical protein